MIRMLAHAVAVAAAVVTVAAGAPADAICQGCGGHVGDGTADVVTSGTGTYAHHRLTASCTHKSSPSYDESTGMVQPDGLLIASASANNAWDTGDPYVTVECRLTFPGPAHYYVDAAHAVHAEESIRVPPPESMPVVRLCMVATATWPMSGGQDTAKIEWCVTPGTSVTSGDTEILRLPPVTVG